MNMLTVFVLALVLWALYGALMLALEYSYGNIGFPPETWAHVATYVVLFPGTILLGICWGAAGIIEKIWKWLDKPIRRSK